MINLRKIAVLDQHTIDKIAAGEVVERPSSVVKELVENAIDAGATAVTVEISDGGKKLIRITDNGGGMEADQVPLAFLRHATSKIEKVEDLEQISSLGFRGEALSSIAAVAQVELITKTPSALSGVRYVIEGGREQSLEEMGAPEGTTFLVRNLFYNTPARSKFLKSDMTEGNYISALMEQLALSHPEISFKYIQNKQVKLHTSGNYSVKDVIYNIYGRDITKSLLEVSYENDFMKVEGFAGKPEISRGNRTFENYYVNGRFVKNKIITKAIEDAYKGFLMQHKFPFVSLHIQMEGNDLDVNVHPTKMEVRFARGPEVYDAVYETVRKALTKREMIPQVSVGKDEKQEPRSIIRPGAVPEPFEVKRREQLQQSPAQPHMLREISGYKGHEDRAFESQSPFYQTPPAQKSPVQTPPVQNPCAQDLSTQTRPFTEEEEEMFSGTLKDGWSENSTTANEPIISDNELTGKQPQTWNNTPKLENVEALSEVMTSQESESISNQVVDSHVTNLLSDSILENEQPTQSGTQPGKPLGETLNEQIPHPATEPPKQLELFEEKLLAPESRSRHQLIGQIFDTYWLVQFEDNFYIIDQHAAHEKVYYERLVKQFKEQAIESQYVSPPLIVTLNLQEEALLRANEEYFREFGFEIEPFGGKEYCISAVPSNLYGIAEEELFLDMLDHLAAEGTQDALSLFTSRLATMACKAAVKGNHKMSALEADKLIDELLTLENPYHCPHGRPTIISMTRAELEKKFKRIV